MTQNKKIQDLLYFKGKTEETNIIIKREKQAKVLNQWETLPTVRSYDTIDLLYNNFTMASASGRQ